MALTLKNGGRLLRAKPNIKVEILNADNDFL
jgi:hypothetical protein